ncbi:MAG: GDP-mannose 4,6-dehydratase [Microbacteriaceae bacterium]
MPRALVTGITGQDGSYLREQLAAAGFEVHGVVRSLDDPDARELRTAHPGINLVEADLGDRERLGRVIDEIAPSRVFHLAGISSVAYSWLHPVETGLLSGIAAAAVLEAALRVQERTGETVQVVQASSAEIFGAAARSPQDETTPMRPSSPYGAAKAYAHAMVGVYRTRGLHASSLILYNHESPRRPEQFVTRKITAAAARIARGRQDRLVLGDVNARRDWGWAPDYTRAMLLAAEAPEPDDYVIATGRSHSVREFVDRAFAAAGIADVEAHLEVEAGLLRPADSAELRGDASHARAALGWRPSVDFDDLVRLMVEHDLEAIELPSRGH